MSEKQRSLWFDQPLTDDDVLNVMSETRWLTYRQIAVKLGRSKSPTLITRIQSLAERGCLQYRPKKLPNGVNMHQFRLDPNCERGMSN